MMCPMGMGMGPKLIAPLVVMSLAYFVLIAAAKQQKALKTLGFVIGIVTILVTGLMFLKGVAKKCSMMTKGQCPMSQMVK